MILAVDEISNNEMQGSIVMREDVDCVVRNNILCMVDISGDYSFICDNTNLTMYDNTIELTKPMIFRYKSHIDIFRNTFKVAAEVFPASMILQTARNPHFIEDEIVRNNILYGSSKLTVNYSAKGIYTIIDNV